MIEKERTEKIQERKKRIALGSAALLASTLTTFAAGFVLAGVMARRFSPEEFGLWGILISLYGIFMNGFDWGFGNALRNRIAQLTVQGRHEEARQYFFSIFTWFVVNACLLTVLFWALKPWIPWGSLLRTSSPYLTGAGSTLFLAGGSFFAFTIAFNLSASGFFGYRESHWNALFNSLAKLSVLAATLLLMVFGASFLLINLASFLAVLGSSVAGFAAFLAIRKWPLAFVGVRTSFGAVRELWGKSALFALLQVFSLVLLNADLFVVSKASGLTAAGDYFLVKRLFLVISTLHFAFLLPIWSEYTSSIEAHDHAWARATLRKTAWYTLMLFSSGCAFLVLFGRLIVLLWTGREMSGSGLFFWMGIWSLFYGWNNCFSVFLNAVGRLKRQVILVMLGAGVFFPLGVFLGERWGTAGICWALILVSIPAAISNPAESFDAIRHYASFRKGWR